MMRSFLTLFLVLVGTRAFSVPRTKPLSRLTIRESLSTLSAESDNGRRRAFLKAVPATLMAGFVLPVLECAAISPPPGMEGAGGSSLRVEGMGGGFDITSSGTAKGSDVIYPSSMDGLWKCQRIIVSAEGDKEQAEVAWRALGGGDHEIFVGQMIESYATRFIAPPAGIQNGYTFENDSFSGVVLDRGFEMEARVSSGNDSRSSWDANMPDNLTYERGGTTTELAVVQRKIELPNEKGFGSNELLRITSYAKGPDIQQDKPLPNDGLAATMQGNNWKVLFGGSKVQRAVRVQRRWRRAFDANGNRIVEGLEIVKTYRVLDGIAGVEMPTSTTKSQIKFTRPPRNQ